jgi:membrane protease subunit (stomatin/prohibitin family)
MVRLRAFGTYAYRVADAQLFVNTIVGSQNVFDTEHLKDFYRDIIVARLNDLIGETLKSIFDLARSYDELATAAKARLAEDFAKYGVDLTDFYVNSITPPDEVQQKIDERAAMGAVGNLDAYMKFKAAQAIQDAARAGGEGGGAAGAGMGLGLGAGFGAMMPGMIAQSMQQAQAGGAAPAAAAAAAKPAATGGFCPDCGQAVPAGAKFCPGCGKKAGAGGCPTCSQPVPAGAKFCPGCGAKLEP